MILSVILAFNLSGCVRKPEVQTVVEQCKNIDLPKKPKPNKYKVIRINFEDKYYYCIDEENAKILSSNWIQYKLWSEEVYMRCKENF